MHFNGKLLSAVCFNTHNVANATLHRNTIFFFSDAAVTYGDCRRQSGVESVRSCGQPKNSESNVVPCEKERICNTNMEL